MNVKRGNGIDCSWVVEEIRRITCDVFTTMLGMDPAMGEAKVERGGPGPTDGVVALVGLAGGCVGIGGLACSGETACRLSSRMLLTEIESVNEEVLDVVAELTNMIIGGLKTAIEKQAGPMALSIPSVVFGRNFTTRAKGSSEWTRIPFTCADGDFEVHICLRPGEGPVNGTADVRSGRLQYVTARSSHGEVL